VASRVELVISGNTGRLSKGNGGGRRMTLGDIRALCPSTRFRLNRWLAGGSESRGALRGMGGKGGCWLLVVLMALLMPELLLSMSIFMAVLRVSLGPTRLGTCGFGGDSGRDRLSRAFSMTPFRPSPDTNAGVELYISKL
jgi:hypothetical protein